MSGYYDRDGNPMTLMEWAERFGDNEYKRVAFDEVGDSEVSTVWLGLDHGFAGALLIFETMVFGGPFEGEQRRYSTEALARAGHADTVRRLREHGPPA